VLALGDFAEAFDGVGPVSYTHLDVYKRQGRHFGYVRDIMAIEAKEFDDLTVDALVGEESHRGIVSRG